MSSPSQTLASSPVLPIIVGITIHPFVPIYTFMHPITLSCLTTFHYSITKWAPIQSHTIAGNEIFPVTKTETHIHIPISYTTACPRSVFLIQLHRGERGRQGRCGKESSLYFKYLQQRWPSIFPWFENDCSSSCRSNPVRVCRFRKDVCLSIDRRSE